MSKYVQLRWGSVAEKASGAQPLYHFPMYFAVALGYDDISGDVALADECPCKACADASSD